MGNGIRVIEARIKQGGRIVSRQYEDLTPEQARKRAQREGRVVSIRKVPLWDYMGSIERLNLNSLVNPVVMKTERAAPKWDGDMLMSDASLEEIVLGKKRKREERRRNKGRRNGNGVD